MQHLLNYFQHAFIGYTMAFIGLLSPGLLTMTTLSTSIDRGIKNAVKFALGAIIPIFIQAHIALLASDYLMKHHEIIKSFSKIAVFVFLLLSIIFFHQYLNRHKPIIKKTRFNIRNSFLYGIFISLINPLAIPFYFTYSTILEFKGLIKLTEPYISIFVFAATAGAFSILYIYAKNAHKMLGKIQFIALHFKLILTIIMLILAVSGFLSGFSNIL